VNNHGTPYHLYHCTLQRSTRCASSLRKSLTCLKTSCRYGFSIPFHNFIPYPFKHKYWSPFMFLHHLQNLCVIHSFPVSSEALCYVNTVCCQSLRKSAILILLHILHCFQSLFKRFPWSPLQISFWNEFVFHTVNLLSSELNSYYLLLRQVFRCCLSRRDFHCVSCFTCCAKVFHCCLLLHRVFRCAKVFPLLFTVAPSFPLRRIFCH
jgi:hypothetical protein